MDHSEERARIERLRGRDVRPVRDPSLFLVRALDLLLLRYIASGRVIVIPQVKRRVT